MPECNVERLCEANHHVSVRIIHQRSREKPIIEDRRAQTKANIIPGAHTLSIP